LLLLLAVSRDLVADEATAAADGNGDFPKSATDVAQNNGKSFPRKTAALIRSMLIRPKEHLVRPVCRTRTKIGKTSRYYREFFPIYVAEISVFDRPQQPRVISPKADAQSRMRDTAMSELMPLEPRKADRPYVSIVDLASSGGNVQMRKTHKAWRKR
jgi:hypothetical protein